MPMTMSEAAFSLLPVEAFEPAETLASNQQVISGHDTGSALESER